MTEVRVRMYRPNGIGDCFLLTFSEGEQVSHMLIDCGVLKGTEEGAERMRQLIRQVRQETQDRLSVLVATHEHWDHVSGFNQAKDEFKHFQIGEVWLGWTEKPNDPRAAELTKKRHKAKKAVESASLKLALSASPAAKDRLAALDGLRQFWGVFGAKEGTQPTTAGAMEWARSGTGGQVRYLKPGEQPLTLEGIQGIRVFVFGPPLEAEMIRRSDPSQRAPEVYELAGGMEMSFLAALDNTEGRDGGRPFDSSFSIPVDQARQQEFFQKTYYADFEWREIDFDWLGSAERLALQLDSDTNNTSLVLAIELVKSGKVLLFPGDAQVGNWLSWETLSWSLPDEHGKTVNVSAYDLLNRTVLYKVGHHASHNATLREKGLEKMQSSQLSALIPVYAEQASEQGKKGWQMPFKPLLDRMLEMTSGRVFRADQGVPGELPKSVEGDYLETDDFIDLFYRD